MPKRLVGKCPERNAEYQAVLETDFEWLSIIIANESKVLYGTT